MRKIVRELIEDGRSRGKEYDITELKSASKQSAKKYWKVGKIFLRQNIFIIFVGM